MTEENTNLNDALASNYLLVDISFRAWGGERINAEATREVVEAKHATRDAAKVRMNLMASADAELKAVRAQIVALRSFVYSRTLPWSLNDEGQKKGSRLIATSDSLQFLADTAAMKKHYDDAVLALQQVWDDRVSQAKQNLADFMSITDPTLYPSAAEVPKLFSVNIELRPMPAVADFNRLTIPASLAEALGQRMAAQTMSQVDNAMNDLRDRLARELQRMSDNLTKAGEGQKTKLYKSMLDNTQALCSLARSMNLTGSPKFNDLIDRIESNLLRYPIETLREDKATAALVAKEAKHAFDEVTTTEWY